MCILSVNDSLVCPSAGSEWCGGAAGFHRGRTQCCISAGQGVVGGGSRRHVLHKHVLHKICVHQLTPQLVLYLHAYTHLHATCMYSFITFFQAFECLLVARPFTHPSNSFVFPSGEKRDTSSQFGFIPEQPVSLVCINTRNQRHELKNAGTAPAFTIQQESKNYTYLCPRGW